MILYPNLSGINELGEMFARKRVRNEPASKYFPLSIDLGYSFIYCSGRFIFKEN